MLKLVAKSLRNKYLHSSKVSPQEVFNYKGFTMEKPGRHHRKQRWKFTSPRNETPRCWEEQGSFLWDSCPKMHNQRLLRKHQTKPHREFLSKRVSHEGRIPKKLSLKETWQLNASWDPGLDLCPRKGCCGSIKIQIRSYWNNIYRFVHLKEITSELSIYKRKNF